MANGACMAQRARPGSTDTVVFNVGGRHHEVLRLTIEARPATLLANLLDDVGTNSAQPLFVDANPDRFAYILDWYRFGEIHLPDGFPTKAILNDARFFLLPDAVKINGSTHTLQRYPEEDLHSAAVASITKHWPTFEQYVTDLIAEVRNEAEAAGVRAKQAEKAPIYEINFHDEPVVSKHIDLMCVDWCDKTNVCSTTRLKVLVAELAKRGFPCEIHTSSYKGRLNGVVLSVGLREGSGAKRLVEPPRVRLDGVRVAMGRLQVCSHHTTGECPKCWIP
mmetsp:Transcript_17455/g.40987  ORF Transcript_17455/g.40987 Transcript_17455/m.40987 type:complete len:278 (-) Transcript_17455:173-1006(-)